MRKKKRIARATAEELAARIAHGEDQTAWPRVNAVLRAFVLARRRAESTGYGPK